MGPIWVAMLRMPELIGDVVYYPMLLLGDITVPLRPLVFERDRLLRWPPPPQLAGRLLLFHPGQRALRFQLKTNS